MNTPLTRESRLARVVAVGALGVFLSLFTILPRLNPFPFCGFHRLTGLPCPLCGGTRAARAILHGDFFLALYLNPLAYGVLFILGTFCTIALIEAIRGRSLADWSGLWERRHRIVLALLVVGILLWWPIHLTLALRKPKTELVNLRNPVVLTIRSLLK